MLRALAKSMEGDVELVEAKALAKRVGVVLLRVTTLLGCTRQAWYSLGGPPPLERPSRHWSRLRGSIFHAALESLAGAETVAEARLVTSLESFGVQAWIAGKVDHYDPVTGQITDYKSMNSFGKKLANLGLPKQHHVAELWIYAWLLGKSGYPYPATGRLIYMDMGTVYACDVALPDTELQAHVEARIVEKARLTTQAATRVVSPAIPSRPGPAATAAMPTAARSV